MNRWTRLPLSLWMLSLAALPGASLLATGCSAVPPDEMPGGRDMAKPAETDLLPTDPELPTLTLGPIPSTTYWSVVKVHGTGPPEGTVLIDNAATGTLSQLLDGGGYFCKDFPLQAGAVNKITLRAVDKFGTIGEPIEISVKQEGSPPAPQPGMASVNAALGGAVADDYSTVIFTKSGKPADVTDGDPLTYYGGRGSLFGDEWVWVELPAKSIINKVRVRSIADCPMQAYQVVITAKAAPADPSSTNPDWSIIGDISMGTGDDTVNLSATETQHVAVIFKSGDCSDLGWGYHKVAEIEAWTQANTPPPAPTAPTCGG